ncbi:MAG: hypothetical protein ACOY93_13290 [Bacillota bacterium]
MRHLVVLALLAVVFLTGCGGRSGPAADPREPTEPASAEPAKPMEPTSPAEPATPAEPARPPEPAGPAAPPGCPERLSSIQPGGPEGWEEQEVDASRLCHRRWIEPATGIELTAILPEGDWQRYLSPQLREVEPVTLSGYPALILTALPEKTGGAFWGPVPRTLLLQGEKGSLIATCSTAGYAESLEEGQAAQRIVDRHCFRILKGIQVGDLGEPREIALPPIDQEEASWIALAYIQPERRQAIEIGAVRYQESPSPGVKAAWAFEIKPKEAGHLPYWIKVDAYRRRVYEVTSPKGGV